MSEDIRHQLYQQMKAKKVFEGDYSQFTSDIDKPEFRKELYKQFSKKGVFSGTYEEFDRNLTGEKKRYSVRTNKGTKYFDTKEEGDAMARTHQKTDVHDYGIDKFDTPYVSEEFKKYNEKASVLSQPNVGKQKISINAGEDFNKASAALGFPVENNDNGFNEYGEYVDTEGSAYRKMHDAKEINDAKQQQHIADVTKRLAELTDKAQRAREHSFTRMSYDMTPDNTITQDERDELDKLNAEFYNLTKGKRDRVRKNIDQLRTQYKDWSKGQHDAVYQYDENKKKLYVEYKRGNISKAQYDEGLRKLGSRPTLSSDIYTYDSDINYNLNEAQKLIDQAERNQGGKTGYFSNLWYGFSDQVLNLRNWDFGVQDLLAYYKQRGILGKFEDKEGNGNGGGGKIAETAAKLRKGEKISDAEQMLLKSVIIKAAAEDITQYALGKGYQDGTITAEALPFMMDFYQFGKLSKGAAFLAKETLKAGMRTAVIRNVSEMLGKSASEAARIGTRTSLKAVGRNGTKLIQKASSIIGQQLGNAAKSAAMTATIGAPRVIGKTIDNMNGEASYDFDDNGNVYFTGVDDSTRFSPMEAFLKAGYESWKENFTEMGGGLVGGAGKLVSHTIGNNILNALTRNNVSYRMLRRYFSKAAAAPFVRSFSNFLDQTQWHGTFDEYWEEVEGNVMDAIAANITDGKWGDGKNFKLDVNAEGSVFNLKDNWDTFRSLAVMGGVTAGLATGAYLSNVYKVNKGVSNAVHNINDAFGDRSKDIIAKIEVLIADGNEVTDEALKDLYSGMDTTQVLSTLSYIRAREQERGVVYGQQMRQRQADTAISEAIDQQIEEEAQEEKPAEEKRDNAKSVAECEQRLIELDNGGTFILQKCDEFIDNQTGFFEQFGDQLDDETKQACLDYFAAVASVKAIEQNDNNTADAAVEVERQALADVPVGGNGEVTYATIDGMTVYIISQDGENVTFLDQRGNVVEGKESDLDRDEDGQPAYHTMNMDDHLAEVWENAHAAQQEKSLHEMSHSVNTPSLNDLRTAYQTGGSVVAALDGESLREMGVSGIITMKDGTVLVGIAPFTRDRSGERILDEDNAKMIPYEDFAAQNDTFWDGQNQMGVEAEHAMTDTTDENEETETEEDSADINDSINDNEVTDENQGEEESGTGEPRSNITTDEDGEPVFDHASVSDTSDYFINEDDEISSPVIDAHINQAREELTAHESTRPVVADYGTRINKFKSDLAAWQTEQDRLQERFDFWTDVAEDYQRKRAEAVESGEEAAEQNEGVPTDEQQDDRLQETEDANETTNETANEDSTQTNEESDVTDERESGETDSDNEQNGEADKPSFLDAIKTIVTKGKDAASKLFKMKFFDVAQTPDFMKDLGITGEKFTIRYGVISRHFGKDAEHTFTEDVWKRLPQAIQTPFAITKYFADEEKKKQKGYRLYTSIRLDNGSYVVVGVEVKNAGKELEVNAIDTMFGRDSISTIHEELIYQSNEITPEQQALLNGHNPRQYPTEQEQSSVGKDNKQISEKQEKEEDKNNDNAKSERKDMIEDVGERLDGAHRRLKEEFDEYLAQQQTAQTTSKNKKRRKTLKECLGDIVSKDPVHASLMGVYHDANGYAVATDGRVMAVSKKLYDKDQSGKIINPKTGESIEGRYPNWQSVIPAEKGRKKVSLDWNKLLDNLDGVRKEMKERSKIAIEKQFVSSFSQYKDEAVVWLRLPDGNVLSFDANQLWLFATAANDLNGENLEYSLLDNTPIVTRSKLGFAVIVQKFVNDYFMTPEFIFTLDLMDKSDITQTNEESDEIDNASVSDDQENETKPSPKEEGTEAEATNEEQSQSENHAPQTEHAETAAESNAKKAGMTYNADTDTITFPNGVVLHGNNGVYTSPALKGISVVKGKNDSWRIMVSLSTHVTPSERGGEYKVVEQLQDWAYDKFGLGFNVDNEVTFENALDALNFRTQLKDKSEELERSNSPYTVEDTRSDINAITLNPLPETDTTLLIEGDKWERTTEPRKFKRNKKQRDDARIDIGNTSYGCTVGVLNNIKTLLDEFGSPIKIWNAYENGKIFLDPETAAIIKQFLKEEYNTPLQNNTHDYKVGDKVMYKGKEATIKAFNYDGRPVLEADLAPIMLTVANWEDISRIEDKEETPVERMLTADEIDSTDMDESMKDAAKEYIKGNTNMLCQIAYQTALDKLKAETPQQRKETKKEVERKRTSRKKSNSPVQGDLNGGQTEGRPSTKPTTERKKVESKKETDEDLQSEVDSLLDEIKNIWSKANKPSNTMYSTVIPGLTPERMEAIAKIMPKLFKVGYIYVKMGMREYQNWSAKMRETFNPILSETLGKQWVNETVRQTWDAPYKVDGKIQPISKWAEDMQKDAEKHTNDSADNANNNVSLQQPQGNSTNFNTDNNGKEETDLRTGTAQSRTGGQQSDKNGTLGGSTENATQQPVTGGMDRRDGAHSANDESGNSGVAGTDASTESNVSVKKNQNNNRAERGKDYAPKSPDARYKANIKAIETLHKIQKENRKATKEEMEVLRQYSGWGGLGGHVERNKQQLTELIGEEAYDTAAKSVKSAYFTPANVIDALWDIAKKLGFKGGKILEGSAGIGNILGLMPQSISDRSDIEAVEIDQISSDILAALYPDAHVQKKGFEQTQIANNSIDLAITNVPFVPGWRVIDETGDKDLSRKFRDLHNFCIAKNIRKLKQGGIGIFLTTRGTLDSSKALRQWITNEGEADVIGAFRLNNDTFGGTNATSDIIIVRKRVDGKKDPNAIDVLNVATERVADYSNGNEKHKQYPVTYNAYFVQHPEFMGGQMAYAFEHGVTYHETSLSLYPAKGIDQQQRIDEWVSSFSNAQKVETIDEVKEVANRNAKLGEDVKEGSLITDSEGNLCVAHNGEAVQLEGKNVNNKVKGQPRAKCLKDYNAIKKALADVLKYQSENSDDNGLKPLLKALNEAYENFVKTYGHLNKNTALSFLKNDVDFSNIMGLEKVTEIPQKDGTTVVTYEKADVFETRVVSVKAETKPQNVEDGIQASLFKFGNISLDFIADALNTAKQTVKDYIIEHGLGFENPTTGELEIAYKYLSGNVREKLQLAKDNNTNGKYDKNIEALEKVIPMDIPAHLIDYGLGASWLPAKLYETYIEEKTGAKLDLKLTGGLWTTTSRHDWNEKNKAEGVFSKMLDKQVLGSELIFAAITGKSIEMKVTKSHGYGANKTTETIADKEATQECARKISEYRDEFRNWARSYMQTHEDFAKQVETIYNDQFNNYVPMSIPETFAPKFFEGMAKVIGKSPFKGLYPHQSKGVIKAVSQNTLFAHEVGTGKTFTLITTAMEMRRLGTAKKPMIVVQNATIGQFAQSAKDLYPNAKILVYDKVRDNGPENRAKFYAKIKYNDWDMVIIPQSVLSLIPDSLDRQVNYIHDLIEEKINCFEILGRGGNSVAAKEIQNEIDKLQDQLADILNPESKKKTKKNVREAHSTAINNAEVNIREKLDRHTDEVEDFDQMDIDALLIDEAHSYKHLGFATTMVRGVKGIDNTASKQSQSLFLKAQAVKEKTNGKNIVFATGTPISNTAAELWTFLRYLMPRETMEAYSIYYFDDFVRTFGRVDLKTEFQTNGKFKEVTRFLGYNDLPELYRIWSEVTDTQLTKNQAALVEKLPETVEGGQKPTQVFLPMNHSLYTIMKDVRRELERFEKLSGKEKKAQSHIPLTMFGIASRAAIDPRLVWDGAADEPNSKTNRAVEDTFKALQQTDSYKGTVAIFADSYQNKQSGFNLYEEIKRKLIEKGVPEDEIFIVESGMSQSKKDKAFDAVNKGKIRVILGSTNTLGTGVNIQERLHTLINMDVPARPMDMTQRNGRILRQGNMHKEWGIPVQILNYGVEDTLDVTGYQRLETKGKFINAIMHGESLLQNNQENRSYEEEDDEVAGYGDVVATLSGSQNAVLKNNAERTLRKLMSKKAAFEADQVYVNHRMPMLKSFIEDAKHRLEKAKAALAKVEKIKDRTITVNGQKYPNVDAMTDLIKDMTKKRSEREELARQNGNGGNMNPVSVTQTINVGGIDFTFLTSYTPNADFENGKRVVHVESRISLSCPELGIENEFIGKRTPLKQLLEDVIEKKITGEQFKTDIENATRSIEKNTKELATVSERAGRTFDQDDEIEEAKEQVAKYEQLMKQEMEEKESKFAEYENDTNIDVDGTKIKETSFSLDDAVATVEADEDGEGEANARFSKSTDLDRMYPNWNDTQTTSTESMSEAVRTVADELHTPVTILTSESDLDASGLSERVRRKLKEDGNGLYIDGKVYVYLPNCRDAGEAARVVLHEVVGHLGLRELIGGEYYDTFLSELYRALPNSVRSEINDRALRNYGGDIYEAMDEYLAEQAELDEHPAWWEKAAAVVRQFLRQHFDMDIPVSENDVRYLLWQSKNQLRRNDIFDEARQKVMRRKLGINKNRNKGNMPTPPNGGVRFSSALPSQSLRTSPRAVMARAKYDAAISSFLSRQKEIWQDSMQGLKDFMSAVMEASGLKFENVKDYENAYEIENHMASENEADFQMFTHLFAEPLMNVIKKLTSGKDYMQQYETLKKYMIAKHGLERNRVFAERDANTSINFESRKAELDTRLHNATTQAEAQQILTETQQLQDELNDAIDEMRNKDYSGLSSLLADDLVGVLPQGQSPTLADYEAAAQKFVNEYESNHDANLVNDLWSKTKDFNSAVISMQREGGQITSDKKIELNSMFDYYVPLRGFEQTTTDDVYDYLNETHSPFSSVVRNANGRQSVADDPIATMANMAQNSITSKNRNKMKRAFLAFVQNHPSDAAVVTDVYYEKTTNAQGVEEWNIVTPNIDDNDDADTINAKVEAFNQQMEALCQSQPDTYAKDSERPIFDYKMMQNNLKEHQIIVFENGRKRIITIQGNPRVAQAMNGLTNPDAESGNRIMKAITRFQAKASTALSPAFVLSNLSRDGIFANTIVWAKETPAYAYRFNANWWKSLYHIFGLTHRYNNNTLDMNNEYDRYFSEFVMKGGRTGYTAIQNVDDHKRLIEDALKLENGGWLTQPKQAFEFIKNAIQFMNESVENSSRFAAYMTSRQMGRSVQKSITDAKEISVNFNKKGSGSKVAGKFEQGNRANYIAAHLSGYARNYIMFFNAGVQALQNFTSIARNHKKEFAGMITLQSAMGMIAPLLASLMGDDDDDYWKLPDYVRRQNLCIYNPYSKGFIKIPLPIELRAFFGLGDLAYATATGKQILSTKEFSGEFAKQLSQILPIDPFDSTNETAHVGSLQIPMQIVPSTLRPIVEALNNRDWTGKPIYKDNEYNKYLPGWAKAYKGTSPYLVEMGRQLTMLGGKHEYDSDSMFAWFNPAITEHLLNGYLGGMFNFVYNSANAITDAANGNDVDARRIPIFNRFYTSVDDRVSVTAAKNFYYKLKERADAFNQQRMAFEKDAKNPQDQAQLENLRKQYTELMRSNDAEIAEVMKDAAKVWKKLQQKDAEGYDMTEQYKAFWNQLSEIQRNIDKQK